MQAPKERAKIIIADTGKTRVDQDNLYIENILEKEAMQREGERTREVEIVTVYFLIN